MGLKNETRWLCENAKTLEQFSGQWIMFNADQGLVGNGGSLLRVLKSARRYNVERRRTDRNSGQPFVFHVPSKRELGHPLLAVHKK